MRLAIGFAVFVYIDCAFCSSYCLGCLWHLFEAGDSEQLTASSAFYSSVGCGCVESLAVAAFRAISDDVHLHGPFGKVSILQLSDDSSTDSIELSDGVHHKFGIDHPIISLWADSGGQD